MLLCHVTLVIPGLSIKVQATLLELLEDQGLPHLCVTMALEEEAGRRLGDVLADAVKVSARFEVGAPLVWAGGCAGVDLGCVVGLGVCWQVQ